MPCKLSVTDLGSGLCLSFIVGWVNQSAFSFLFPKMIEKQSTSARYKAFEDPQGEHHLQTSLPVLLRNQYCWENIC